jgi:hypothetical protein
MGEKLTKAERVWLERAVIRADAGKLGVDRTFLSAPVQGVLDGLQRRGLLFGVLYAQPTQAGRAALTKEGERG